MHTTLIVQSYITPPSSPLADRPSNRSWREIDGALTRRRVPSPATSNFCPVSLLSHMEPGLPHIHPDLASQLYLMFCPRDMQSATSAITVAPAELSYIPRETFCEMKILVEARR